MSTLVIETLKMRLTLIHITKQLMTATTTEASTPRAVVRPLAVLREPLCSNAIVDSTWQRPAVLFCVPKWDTSPEIALIMK